ncbi:hypothetical protein A9236_01390 [Polynucleobacter sp. QLW-P1DATA-2]|nr:hypothetical protein A9236_01390 [Polynucleobacter sp. QLW-P1DATA-2]
MALAANSACITSPGVINSPCNDVVWIANDLTVNSSVGATGAFALKANSNGTFNLTNNGSISNSTSSGISYLSPHGGDITNSLSKTISGGVISDGGSGNYTGGAINNQGHIGNIQNLGSIDGGIVSWGNQGPVINKIQNSGSITGGIQSDGTISSASIVHGIENSGFIIGGIANTGSSAPFFSVISGGIINSGTIADGISNFGGSQIDLIRNSTSASIITGGISNSTGSTIENISNSGAITDSNNAIYSDGRIGALSNNSGGLIQSLATSGVALNLDVNSSIPTLTNAGTISGGANAIYSGGSIGELNNNLGGVIEATVPSSNALSLDSGSIINTLNNNFGGEIRANVSGGTAITLDPGSSITTLKNAGTISGGADGISLVGATITKLTNTGSIIGTSGYGIRSDAYSSIVTLNNLQGQGNIAGPLTYTGTLPTNYNIIINDTNHYGQLAGFSITGGLTFGVDSSSILSAQTYLAVLSGLTSSNITNYSSIFNTWTNFNSSYKWELIAGANPTTWDLVVAALAPPPPVATNITGAGTIYQSSNLGTTVNPVFDGGTLQVSNAGSVTPSFTITSNNGVIDQNGVASNFTGNITNSGAGVNGKLTIVNSGAGGSVALSGNNTYSGGTEVQAGANLSISSANNIGSGTLALVGSSTIPATLTTTASMTLNNQLTVSGDPVFNVASGTTTTISSPITNGVTAGDVVVEGGGILALTAANTYTGLTSITAGSTLALSGAGLIAASSNVTNNGTFNIAGKTSNVSVASYTQGTTGTLAMGIAPSNTPKLNVAGVASLAGGLSLTASSGSYAPGKYTLLTANGGVTGSFGNLTTNLSSYTRLGYGLAYDANDVYLVFTPNVADTQQSLVNTASALQNIYTLQNSVLANSFSYDCNEFGANGVCISVGGRNTAVSAANGLNNTSGLLIAAYRPHQNYRIGAYVDQNLSVNNAGSTVNLGNNTPLIGLFGAWNERLDGTGAEVKVSAAYGQKNTTINRQVVGTSEAGSGSSQLNSQGAQVTAKYGFGVVEHVIVAPYVGIRYTQNNMGGYTEGTSATVTAPLTYSALNTNATTALAGLGASYRFIPQAGVFGSVGVETDTNTANGTYSATGVTGLTPINFNANPVKTRPTATIGAYYDIEKNQRLGINGIYRQEPFQAVSTTSVMATYTIGM